MKKIIVALCLSLLVLGGIAGSVQADSAVVSYFFDGLDLDTGTVERDRTMLLLIIGEPIEELLRPTEPLTDFSPAADVSFDFDPAAGGSLELVLQDNVKIAVLKNMDFESVGGDILGHLTFSDEPISIPITSDDVVVAWTEESHYFKLGCFSQLPDFQLEMLVEEIEIIIPEPSTLIFLTLGLVGIIWFVRRKKRLPMILLVAVLVSLLGAQSLHAQAPIVVKKAGPGTGTVLAGDQECNPECEFLYEENKAILLKAIPDMNSYFDRWAAADGSVLEETFKPKPGDIVLAFFAASIEPGGGTVSDGLVSVTFPVAATSQRLYISIVKKEDEGTPVSDAYEIQAMNAWGEPVTQFDDEIAITLPYNPAAVGSNWEQLALEYYDEASSQWIALPSTVDPVNYTVTGFTNHLMDFRVGSNSCQVGNNEDSGNGSLRQVLADAASNGCTTITFVRDLSPIILSSQLEISSGTLIIDGGASGVTISGNNSTRVFSVESEADVTFENLTITQGVVTGANCPDGCGGGIMNSLGRITIGNDTTISGNTATTTNQAGGGGILNYKGVVVVNGMISGNAAKGGGGIYNQEGEVTINGKVSGNTATDKGGGIYNQEGEVTINGTVIGNTAADDGGGINNNGGTLTVSGTVANNNTTALDGGGINNGNDGIVIIELGGSVNNNTAATGAGGIDNHGGTVTVNGTISENTANSTGGGIRNHKGGVLTVNGTVENNTAGYGGGINNQDDSTFTLNGIISGNTANVNGGGIDNIKNGIVIINGTISGNMAGADGGGIHNVEDAMITINGTISGNTADGNGGGIFNVDNGTVNLESANLIEKNTAGIDGGGIANFLAGIITGAPNYGSGNAPDNCAGVGCPLQPECTGSHTIENSINVFACQFAGGYIVNSEGWYWIRMSIGFESDNGEAEARADQPNISLAVTMNGTTLPMDGDTVVEYNDGAGFWEINSYHCTGTLAPGTYTIIGTSYRSGEYVGSATCVLTAQ